MTTPQCSNCFFSFIAPADADPQTGPPGQPPAVRFAGQRYCNKNAPLASNQNPVTWLWPRVADDFWCGDGADASSGTSYHALVNDASGWQDWISTITPASGTFASQGTLVARFLTSGTTVFFYIEITITVGTAVGPFTFTLPIVAADVTSFAGSSPTNLKAYSAQTTGGSVLATVYDATGSPTITTDTLAFAGFYET